MKGIFKKMASPMLSTVFYIYIIHTCISLPKPRVLFSPFKYIYSIYLLYYVCVYIKRVGGTQFSPEKRGAGTFRAKT